MDRQTQIAEALRDRYGLLLHSLHKRDYGWHCFEVVWSDDGGTTTIADTMTVHDMPTRLAKLTKKHVADLLQDARRRCAPLVTNVDVRLY